MSDEKNNPQASKDETPKAAKHDPSEYAAPAPQDEIQETVHPVLSKTEDKPAEDPKEAPKEPKKKEPLDAKSKKGLILACTSIGVVVILITAFLVVGYRYIAKINGQTEMGDTGSLAVGFFDQEGKSVENGGKFTCTYQNSTTNFSLDKINVATADVTSVLLPYYYYNEASGNQAYYVASTPDFNDQSNLFEANGKVDQLTAIYAERYYQKIGAYAFSNLPHLKVFTMANTSLDDKTTFGDYAFSGDSALERFVTPNTLSSIGVSTFENCSALATFSLPKACTSIGANAFKGASALTRITYTGVMAEFKAITKGANWRDSTLKEVVCTNGTLTDF
jgi:hypothetical protein